MKNLDVGNNVHVIKIQVIHRYESKTKDIYKSYVGNMMQSVVLDGNLLDKVVLDGN